MKNYWCLILLIFCLTSCHEDAPDIEKGVLHNLEIPLFEIDSVFILTTTPELEIRVYYSSIHAQLTDEQKALLQNTLVLDDGDNVDRKFIQTGDGTENLNFFFNDVVQPGVTCYDFFLSGRINDGVGRSRVTELCVDI